MPDPIIITNDAEAQATLIRAGQQLPTPQPLYTKSVLYFRHTIEGRLYYCMASFECGHPEPRDNGYVVICLPAPDFSPASAAEFFTETVRATSYGPIVSGWLTPTFN